MHGFARPQQRGTNQMNLVADENNIGSCSLLNLTLNLLENMYEWCHNDRCMLSTWTMMSMR